jgi:4-diphosphocytidyl-2-C-methyl-D-erythritol kinase
MAHPMATSVRIQAAAKVNVHLRIYGRRQDGYHDILSLFQAVAIMDDIVVRSLKEPETVHIDGEFDCQPQATTIFKAVEAYRSATGIRKGVSISVAKGIPAGGGLGGGSSDAAACLRGLDALFGSGLGDDFLARLGARIGSDVPFFFGAAAALVQGRGERLCPLPARDDLFFVIADPRFPIGTAWAYDRLDALRPDDAGEPDPSPDAISAAYRGDPRSWPFANSFEGIVGSEKPEIPALRGRLVDLGAQFAIMSGSGSSVVGVFPDPASAEAARRALERGGARAAIAAPLARIPGVE